MMRLCSPLLAPDSVHHISLRTPHKSPRRLITHGSGKGSKLTGTEPICYANTDICRFMRRDRHPCLPLDVL
jgi:hypothetical protein